MGLSTDFSQNYFPFADCNEHLCWYTFKMKGRRDPCTYLDNLKCPWDEKIHFLFFFRFWKCVCLISDWQNLELWFLSKGRSLWVSVLDFTDRHYSRAKLTDWTSEGWIPPPPPPPASQAPPSLILCSVRFVVRHLAAAKPFSESWIEFYFSCNLSRSD